MSYPPAASRDYRVVQRLKLLVVGATRRAWAGMGEDFDESWQQVGPKVTAAVTAGQLAAATQGAGSVAGVVDELDVVAPAQAQVVPRRFAGVAADGRSLTGLLEGAVSHARVAVAGGLATDEALAVGGRWMEALARTAVTDAHRGALAAGVVARDRLGWVRMVNPPCCGRCAVLAGRWYRWSDGFERHLQCDCKHVPAPESVSGQLTVNPQALHAEGLVQGLTVRERARLTAGADLTTVVNESRDMWLARTQDQRSRRRRARTDGSPAAAAPRPSLDGLLGALRADIASREEGRARLAAAGFLTP